MSIKKLKNGNYLIKRSYRLKGYKHPKEMRKTVKNKIEAKNIENEMIEKIKELQKEPEKLTAMQKANLSVLESFTDWVEYSNKKNNWSLRTYRGYKKLYKWITDFFSGIKIKNLSENLILRSLEPYKEKKHSYEAKYSALNRFLIELMQKKIINFNPMYDITKPSKKIKREVSKNNALELKDIEILTNWLKNNSYDNPLNDAYKIAIGIGLLSGLRTSELRALTWDKVIETKKGIYFRIDRSMEAPNDKNIFKETKTGVTRNTFYIPIWFSEILKTYKRKLKEKLSELKIIDENNFVLISIREIINNNYSNPPLPIKEQNINKHLRNLQRKFNINLGTDESGNEIYLSLYNLRHTYATSLHKSGEFHDIDIATSLGHNLSTFLKTYVNPSELERETSDEKINTIF